MKNDNRIHIKPGDWLADIDEMPDGKEPLSRCRYFVEPYGPFQINEAGEANYFTGNMVPYHEHTSGYETFLVDGGSVEVSSRSRKAIARKGDIVHIQPYVPHSIYILEDGTIWRAFHQGLGLIQHMIEERRMQENYPELFKIPNFRQDVPGRGRNSVWFDYVTPECAAVSAGELPEIRTLDDALAEFDFEGLNLKLKVGRWETGGAREVWQIGIKSGYSFSWTPVNIFPLLFDVYDGSVEVEIDGMEAFTANTRDLLHMPKFLGGRLTALKDTVLFDMGCQGYLMRYLDEVNAIRAREPEKLKDADFLNLLMKKYDYYIQYKF